MSFRRTRGLFGRPQEPCHEDSRMKAISGKELVGNKSLKVGLAFHLLKMAGLSEDDI